VVSRRRSSSLPSLLVVVAVIVGYLLWTRAGDFGSALPDSAAATSTTATSTTATSTTATSTTATTSTAGAKVVTIDAETGLPWIDGADLPSQGRAVLASIDKGGPYPYSQDGGTFSNAEKLLPLTAKGFYTEYTVKLPSSSDRGPVRIIMGGKGQWYFWTENTANTHDPPTVREYNQPSGQKAQQPTYGTRNRRLGTCDALRCRPAGQSCPAWWGTRRWRF